MQPSGNYFSIVIVSVMISRELTDARALVRDDFCKNLSLAPIFVRFERLHLSRLVGMRSEGWCDKRLVIDDDRRMTPGLTGAQVQLLPFNIAAVARRLRVR